MFKVIRNIIVFFSVFFVFIFYNNMNDEQERENIFNQISLDLIKNLSGGYLKFFLSETIFFVNTELSVFPLQVTCHIQKVLLVFHPSGTIIFISQMFDGFFYFYKSVFGMKVTVP